MQAERDMVSAESKLLLGWKVVSVTSICSGCCLTFVPEACAYVGIDDLGGAASDTVAINVISSMSCLHSLGQESFRCCDWNAGYIL